MEAADGGRRGEVALVNGSLQAVSRLLSLPVLSLLSWPSEVLLHQHNSLSIQIKDETKGVSSSFYMHLSVRSWQETCLRKVKGACLNDARIFND